MASKSSWVITSAKFLSPEQIQSLLTNLENQRDLSLLRGKYLQAVEDYFMIRTMLETGVRVFEFCLLQIGDFEGLKLTVKRGKGNKARTILLTRTTHLLIKEWLVARQSFGYSNSLESPLFPNPKGTSLTTRAVQLRVKKCFKQAMLPSHLSAHSLRHTYATLLIGSGKVGLATVRDNLGHSSLSITNLYSHSCTDISDVSLIPQKTSDNCKNSEVHQTLRFKNSNGFKKAFLRNMKQKSGDAK